MYRYCSIQKAIFDALDTTRPASPRVTAQNKQQSPAQGGRRRGGNTPQGASPRQAHPWPCRAPSRNTFEDADGPGAARDGRGPGKANKAKTRVPFLLFLVNTPAFCWPDGHLARFPGPGILRIRFTANDAPARVPPKRSMSVPGFPVSPYPAHHHQSGLITCNSTPPSAELCSTVCP